MGFLFRKKQTPDSVTVVPGGQVNVVGDSTARELYQELTDAGFQVAHKPVGPNQNVIIAQDATQGIAKLHTDLVHQIIEAQSALIMIVFTNLGRIADPELLELEELEFRDFLLSAGIDGDAITVAYASEDAPISGDTPACPVGTQAIIKSIKQLC